MFSYRAWIDTHKLARKAWPTLQRYTLAALSAEFGISYGAHAAMEDARAAGEIFLRAQESVAVAQS